MNEMEEAPSLGEEVQAWKKDAVRDGVIKGGVCLSGDGV